MDRYLFRGLRTDGEGWVYGNLVVANDNKAVHIYQWKQNIKTSYIHEIVEVIPETVGQWTGLTDKNEVKIFEGDIIVSEIEEVSGVIRYFGDDARYSLEMSEDNGLYDLDARYTYEVIGNIHEEGNNALS